MAGTYTQIYIHIIFSVRKREKMIRGENKEELNKCIKGIITKKNIN